MKLKKKIVWPVVLLILAIFIVMMIVKKKEALKTTYTFSEITRGDIENTVNATGTIEPVTLVEVGTQVSGIIDKLNVDFNDKVKKNQLLAVIDTTILSLQVRDARASVLRAEAQFNEAKYNYERTEKLYKENLLSELEYITAKSNYQSALSSLQSSQNNLERAERNMKYAFIRSPIDGTVIYREVEEGQTVASSFQTPRLFLIAEDLSKMEIHALVDESEIGLIEKGQDVRFEVQSHGDKIFKGLVRQVWLQPEAVQNVVNYTVVVDADNPDGLLLPGMTATLDFIVEQKKDVLLAPASALRIEPTVEMKEIMKKRMQERFAARGDSSRRGPGPGAIGSSGESGSAGGPRLQGFGSMADGFMGNQNGQSQFGILWFFDENNKLQMYPVRKGSTDGRNTEIFPMGPGREDVVSGLKVISAIETSGPVTGQITNNNRPMGGFGRPPF